MPTLIEARISVEPDYGKPREISGQHVSKLISKMNNTASLYLLDWSLEALFYSRCSLPPFQNLTFMELGIHNTSGRGLIPGLLEVSPNLERIIFKGFTMAMTEELPVTTPVCLARCLKEIEIRQFYGLNWEFKMVDYFLCNGQALKKMEIYCTFKMIE